MQEKYVNYANFAAYVEAGVIQSFYLVPFPMAKGWAIWAQGTNGLEYVLERARGDQRRFASADTAIEAIKGFGWRKPVTVHLD